MKQTSTVIQVYIVQKIVVIASIKSCIVCLKYALFPFVLNKTSDIVFASLRVLVLLEEELGVKHFVIVLSNKIQHAHQSFPAKTHYSVTSFFLLLWALISLITVLLAHSKQTWSSLNLSAQLNRRKLLIVEKRHAKWKFSCEFLDFHVSYQNEQSVMRYANNSFWNYC